MAERNVQTRLYACMYRCEIKFLAMIDARL